MKILNFGHPLDSTHLRQIEALAHQAINDVVTTQIRFDYSVSFAEQVRTLVDGLGITGVEWQTIPILVNPPGYAPAATVLLAELD